MTSYQMKARLAEATRIVALCEEVFEDIDRAHRRGTHDDAENATREFMDRHRQEERDGGQS